MKTKIILAVCLLLTMCGFAQQDPQYSQYMFNQMAINPAYAGSKDALCATGFVRSQWTAIDGAPKTESLTLHSPMKGKKVGLGISFVGDQIGPKKSVGALGSYAYRLPIKNGMLAFGLRVGVYNYMYNWDISHKDGGDEVYTKNANSKIVPTADAGIYYNTNSLYAGFSVTHLYNGRLTTVSSQDGDNAKLSPHYFFTFGQAWSLCEKLIFNPSIMIKTAKNSPATTDINLSFLLDQKIWLGVSLRTNYGIVAYTQFNVSEKWKIGYAFDLGANKIGKVGGGSHELMLGYNFNTMCYKYYQSIRTRSNPSSRRRLASAPS